MLVHYSAARIEELEDRDPGLRMKPAGLYLAHGDSWADFAREAGLKLGEFRYHARIAPHARIFVVDGPESLERLHDAYGQVNKHSVMEIRWTDMRHEYDGIELRAFHELRFHTLWTYAMDMDCVCVWNARDTVSLF
jgi:hypothetical protein